MKITKCGPVLALGMLFAFLVTSPVHADTVYTYTGTPFTTCFGKYTCTSTGPLRYLLRLTPRHRYLRTCRTQPKSATECRMTFVITRRNGLLPRRYRSLGPRRWARTPTVTSTSGMWMYSRLQIIKG